MRSPVLFLVFNRPEPTRRVFEAIRAARPPRLYVAADGARPEKAGEAQRCDEVRSIATAVDWPCAVRSLFRESNLGCRGAVSGAISWFFEHEAEGIILEDDVLPSQSFFTFCDELLDRYRDDRRVMHISADYFAGTDLNLGSSYVFSRYIHIWGWATWRRAWSLYDPDMKSWPAIRGTGDSRALIDGPPRQRAYWTNVFDAVHSGTLDTWDYQWQFACRMHDGVSALPTVNLARNIGFTVDATHTQSAPAWIEHLPVGELAFPLRHPGEVTASRAVDLWEDRHLFKTRQPIHERLAASVEAMIRRLGGAIKRRILPPRPAATRQ